MIGRPANFENGDTAGLSAIQGAFELDELVCFPNPAQPASYYYVPHHAQPQRGVDGEAMVNLIAAGATGFLQLTASWDVPGETLEALRREIAARESIEDPATVRLAFAPVQIEGCVLLVGDGSGEPEVLARSATSGMPPYSAMFSVALNEEQLANAAAAINGRPGFLVVRYDAWLPVPVEVVARLSGDATDSSSPASSPSETRRTTGTRSSIPPSGFRCWRPPADGRAWQSSATRRSTSRASTRRPSI